MKIDRRQAERVVRTAADEGAAVDAEWAARVEHLSQLCEDGVSKTHIAFLGTAIIAKAVDARADLFAIKPSHDPGNPHAFSARSLCHGVLVPLAAELGFSIGVTGREPLNNQPYFRMTRLDDGTPVHPGGRQAFDYMLDLVRMLQGSSEQQAQTALRAFIEVRRRYLVRYAAHDGQAVIAPRAMLAAITSLVREDAEGGRRAQGVAAGLFDIVFGAERVESGRINDPSRKYPGDVCVRDAPGSDHWEKAVEVRDKPVTEADVRIFCAKCLSMGVRDAAVLMVSDRQQRLDDVALADWAQARDLGLTLFYGWQALVDQALFWSTAAKPVAAGFAVGFIHARLITVEASAASVAAWVRLTQPER